MRKALLIILVTICVQAIKAQDPFVTQKFNNPTFTNPALTGNGEKLNRLSFFYRDQWRSVPVKYVSTFFNYDRKLLEKKNNLLGGGIQFIYDKAGTGSLSTFNPTVSFSYTRYFNEKKQGLSAGFNIGYNIRTVKLDELQFDNQFNGVGFDPSLGNGENLGSSSKFLNLGLGVNFMTKIGNLSKLDFGFALYNPHTPSNSFELGDAVNTSERPIQYDSYVTTELFVNDKWSLTPSFFFQAQEKAKEFHSSLFASYYTRNPKTPIKLSFGGGYRNDDAAFAYTGLKVKDVQVGISYDINTSSFQDATNKRGGFEMSLVYEFERKKKTIIDTPEIEIDTIYLTVVDTLIEEEFVEPAPPVVVNEPEPEQVKFIRRELPIKIFFDNDQPNPRSKSATTNEDYYTAYNNYLGRRPYFVSAVGYEESQAWFAQVYNSKAEFDTLGVYVKQLLDTGYDVKLTIKGYASPLGKDDYNTNLTMRRIESVVLALQAMDDAALLPFFNNGRIQIIRSPFGESYAPENVDSSSNTKKSVYSAEASYERRVEIIAIEAELK